MRTAAKSTAAAERICHRPLRLEVAAAAAGCWIVVCGVTAAVCHMAVAAAGGGLSLLWWPLIAVLFVMQLVAKKVAEE